MLCWWCSLKWSLRKWQGSLPLPSCLSIHCIVKFWEFLQELKRFPTLQSELAQAAIEALERMRDDSRKTSLRLVDMESSYLTVDFFRKLPQEVEKGGNPGASTMDRYTDGHLRRIGKLNPLSLLKRLEDFVLAFWKGNVVYQGTGKLDPLVHWNYIYEGASMFWQVQMCLHMWTWSVSCWGTLFQKLLCTVKFVRPSGLYLTISMPKLGSERYTTFSISACGSSSWRLFSVLAGICLWLWISSCPLLVMFYGWNP